MLGAGMRPIVNLGSHSVATFPGVKPQLSWKRRRKHEKVKLVFKPVNQQLQNVLQVSATIERMILRSILHVSLSKYLFVLLTFKGPCVAELRLHMQPLRILGQCCHAGHYIDIVAQNHPWTTWTKPPVCSA